jgi:hypothetical protein
MTHRKRHPDELDPLEAALNRYSAAFFTTRPHSSSARASRVGRSPVCSVRIRPAACTHTPDRCRAAACEAYVRRSQTLRCP